MFTNIVLVSGLLWGQAINVPPRFGESTETAPTPSKLAPADMGRSSAPAKTEDRPAVDSSRTKDLLAECLAPRPGSALTGKALELATALGTLQEGKSRFDIVAAYWRLLRQAGEYQLWFDYDQQLQALRAAPQVAAQLKTAQAASEASLHEAELTALAAQQELASLLQWPSTSPPPLPADRPHVGAYRTQFDELFTGRSVPVRARLLNQTLPLRRQILEARAVAATSASEAWTGAVSDYRSGQADLTRLLACLSELRVQRAAFIAAVCQYNQLIADYVLNVVAPSASAENITAMLIKTSRKPASSEEKKDEKKSGGSASSTGPTPAQPALGAPRPDTFGSPSGPTSAKPDSPSDRGISVPNESIYRGRNR